MNKTAIEWTNFSWNPIFGCDHGCYYCYAKKITQRFPNNFPNGFKPTFHPERLGEINKLKKPAKIFVCSCADLFASWTPVEWRNAVFESMSKCPVNHTFQMLTKNPERIPTVNQCVLRCASPIIYYPENWWFGTTVTGEGDIKNIDEIRKVGGNRFVSFEPLLRFLEPELDGIDWVIIGKLTCARRVKMERSWVMNIVDEATRVGAKVFMKNNLRKEFPNMELRQEFPEGMV